MALTRNIYPVNINWLPSGYEQLAPSTDGVYDRRRYMYYGLFFIISTDKEHQPENGETWVVSSSRDDATGRPSNVLFRYDALTDCIWQYLQNTANPRKQIVCGLKVGTTEPDDTKKAFPLYAPFDGRCDPEKTYYRIALTLPGQSTPTHSSRYKPTLIPLYRPIITAPYIPPQTTQPSVGNDLLDGPSAIPMPITTTNPAEYSIIPSNITPRPSGESHLILRVEPQDTGRCTEMGRRWIYNVKVAVVSEIGDPSAHTHLNGTSAPNGDATPDAGKGVFAAVDDFPATLENEVPHTLHYPGYEENYTTNSLAGRTADIDDAMIDGPLYIGERKYNRLDLKYVAGPYGLGENIRVKLTRDTEDPWFDPRYDSIDEVSGSVSVTSRVPDLIELPLPAYNENSELPYVMAYGDSCGTHAPQARWVSARMHKRILDAAWVYHWVLGTKVSFNDASLPLGGVFDREASGWTWKCHNSHRDGNHIDINSTDSGGFHMYDEFAFRTDTTSGFIGDFTYEDGEPVLYSTGPGVTRLYVFNLIADDNELVRNEASSGIHYQPRDL